MDGIGGSCHGDRIRQTQPAGPGRGQTNMADGPIMANEARSLQNVAKGPSPLAQSLHDIHKWEYMMGGPPGPP